MPDTYITGLPGVRLPKTATHFKVFKQILIQGDLALGRLIDGVNARDPLNVDPANLRPGLLMGKITSSSLYAPSVLGLTTVAYTSGQTTLTVSTATATELVRRVGASGTFNLTGAPSANGTVAVTLVTYSAVVTSTGVITVTNIGVNYILGSMLQPTDGSQTILSFLPDGYPLRVLDLDGVTNLTVPYPQMPIAGIVQASALENYPSDTTNLKTLQTYIKTALNGADGGQYVFDDRY